MIPGIFTVVLAWLASQSAAEAKVGAEPNLNFTAKEKPPNSYYPGFFDSELDVGSDVVSRVCCSFSLHSGVDMSDLASERHDYRKNTPFNTWSRGGGTTGYVYTRRGGFIDLGHVRDHIDYTRFFANKFWHARNSGQSGNDASLISEEGGIRLVIAPRIETPSLTLAAFVGARLAYERALWHEIFTYFSAENISSFSPEDNFSNAVGVLVGFRALLASEDSKNPPDPGLFNQSADRQLFRVLTALGHATKEETDKAIAYVKNFWWTFAGLKRRNLDAFSPVKPWLVTEVANPDKISMGRELREALRPAAPASISIPTEYSGVPLNNLAFLEIASVNSDFSGLVPALAAQGVIKSSDFPTLVQKLRATVRTDIGLVDADSPGPTWP